MFERFTKVAKRLVLDAVTEAEHARADTITAEHLMLALLRDGTRSGPLLADAGLTREAIRAEFASANRRAGLTESEAKALGDLGIDLTAIVDRVEATHGKNALAPTPRPRRLLLNHIPFSPEAKSVLNNSLAQAREHGARHIADEHFLLAMAAANTRLPATILAAHGLPHATIKTRLAKAS
ncbi:Clp protease N-terminal domain-containing protein [Actinophytocola sediminis]